MAINTHTFWEKASYTWSEDSVRLFPTASDTARELFFYCQELGYFKTEPPYFTERENLNSFLLVYTISGEGALDYEGAQYRLKAGDAFWINCNKHHHYKTVSREPWEFLWIHFNGAQAYGYYQTFASQGYRILHTLPENVKTDSETESNTNIEAALKAESQTDSGRESKIEELMRAILELHQENKSSTELLTSSYLTAILTEFLMVDVNISTATTQIPELLQNVRHFLDVHFREELHFDRIAEEFSISKYHLSREFRKYIGMTMQEYVIHLRLAHAKELLLYSKLSVSEIAYESGMNYPSYFIRIFKDREGCTPEQYRKEWRSNS